MRWTSQEINALDSFYQISSREQVEELLPGRSWSSIVHKANRRGLKTRDSKISYKRNFFKVPNLISSYYAGLLAADGNVYYHKDNGCQVVLGLHEDDGLHVSKFADTLGYTGNLKTYKNGKHNIVRLSLCKAKELARDLEANFNITPNKSLSLQPPKLAHELSLAYLIGYIDGDGCIGSYKNNIGRDTTILTCVIVGTEGIVNWAKALLNLTNKVQDKGNYYRIAFNGKRALEILQHLKQISVPHLKRKWDKVPD